ncbi:hypothetical protein CHH83_02535 [Bacillus sp. 7586-K]|nr:hypothetical protein CHH83_02535 [Bacillus sp. 7586-K]
MIIRINGTELESFTPSLSSINLKEYLPKSKKEAKKIKKLSIWLWSLSGTMFLNNQAYAASDIWIKMQPLWSVFQDIAMVIGGIAIFSGLLIFYFKRNLGKSVIVSSALVIGGCFLVPSLIMLIAIIGNLMNDVLMDVFQNMDLKDSVKVDD